MIGNDDLKCKVTIELYKGDEVVKTEQLENKDGLYVLSFKEVEFGALAHGVLMGKVELNAMCDAVLNTLYEVSEDNKGLCYMLHALFRYVEKRNSEKSKEFEITENIKVNIQEFIKQFYEEELNQ